MFNNFFPRKRRAFLLLKNKELELKVASSFFEKLKGYSFSSFPENNEGMLFLFDELSLHNFWMCCVAFDLWLIGFEVIGKKSVETLKVIDIKYGKKFSLSTIPVFSRYVLETTYRELVKDLVEHKTPRLVWSF